METTKVRQALIIITALCIQTSGYIRANDNWKKTDSENGISIYERWVKVNSNLTVKERRGEMTIKASKEKVLEILCDPAKTKLWMENVNESYLLKRPNDKLNYSYTQFTLPWPFDNRDLVSEIKLTQVSSVSTTIEMISRENIIPNKENVKRLGKYKAEWKISDLGNGYVNVSLTAISYTSPEFPRFIQDPLVSGVFKRNLINLKLIICQ